MDLVTAAIAVSLALDCFSVALGAGTFHGKTDPLIGMRMAASFGAFQSGMLLAGWGAGSRFTELVAEYDHWIAFILLTAVAVHMIHEALRDGCSIREARFSYMLLLALSIATSIDALVVGFSLSFLKAWIVPTSVMAGLTSFTLTIMGYYLGVKTGCLIGGRAGAVGGAILILVGLKILLEHLLA